MSPLLQGVGDLWGPAVLGSLWGQPLRPRVEKEVELQMKPEGVA